jgi:hypothetical protein
MSFRIFALVLVLIIFASVSSVLAQSEHPKTKEPLIVTCYKGTPTLDGKLNEWENIEPAVLDVAEQVQTGIAFWEDASDCSGKFYMMWDDTNIYIGVKVKDDKIVTTQAGGDIWKNDCAEIFFATTNAVAGHEEHYQYGATPNELKWNWCNMHGPGQEDPHYEIVKASETADGYAMEIAIEYGQVKSLDFENDTVIGFHPVLDDCDRDGAERDLQISWTGLPAHDQTTGFGHLILSSLPIAVSAKGRLAATWSQLKLQ